MDVAFQIMNLLLLTAILVRLYHLEKVLGYVDGYEHRYGPSGKPGNCGTGIGEPEEGTEDK